MKEIDKRLYQHLKYNGKDVRICTDLLYIVNNGQKRALEMNKPNVVAIYLSISDNAYENSLKKIKEIKDNKKYNPDLKQYFLDVENADNLIFDFLELIFTTIVFSYMAVEAFVNSMIPLDYCYTDKEIYNCQEIQRHIPLATKIKEILPEAYKYKFVANRFKPWVNFTALEKHRDELIHLKKENYVKEGKNYKSTQLKFIIKISEDIIDKKKHASAREIIKYLSLKIGKNTEIPLEFNNSISDLKDVLNS